VAFQGAYQGIWLDSTITIQELFSLHYFEYRSDFVFPGEQHDFWEFVCADKGEVLITAGTKQIRLEPGDVAFHEPNEFHAVRANGVVAPNLLVVSFSTYSPDMDFFRHRILHIDAAERAILASIVREGHACFGERLDDPWLTSLTPLKDREWGCEQMIRLKIEEFLLHIHRRYAGITASTAAEDEEPIRTVRRNSDREVMHQIIEYMRTGISRHLTLDIICKDNMISRSRLQQLFRVYEKRGVIDYFSWMKIETAKEMIRTASMNFTQIADFLGYSSVHYFSRQFRRQTGMSPSEYASSIKAAAESDEAEEGAQL
jgi:AraC-like DNA-binding protein/quercetin dioxygenase-like cupin family protein